MKRARVALVAAAAALAAFSAYAAYEPGSGNVLSLQACTEVDPSPASWICEQPLFWFHPTADEVKEMNRTAGALLAVSARDQAFRRKLLKHYLAAGVGINARDERTRSKWVALHGAAIEPSLGGVELLLEHGADPSIQDAEGKTALDRARQLQERLPSPERAAVIRALDAASRPAR